MSRVYCPQIPMLWDKLTVDEHFELFARAYGLEEEASARAVRDLLDGAYSSQFHAGGELALSLGWTAALGLAVYLLLRRAVGLGRGAKGKT